MGKLLGGDIRFAAAKSRRLVNSGLPRETVNSRGTKIADLEWSHDRLTIWVEPIQWRAGQKTLP